MKPGCYTALITPFKKGRVDYEGIDRLTAFQIENGISGILAVGTTGESPTLSWDEHNDVIAAVAENSTDDCICIAGTGSNNTRETLAGTRHAQEVGARAVLLVDPYYNGPSSLEIRREYVAPVAAAFPELTIIPYVIPGRTGAQLLPEDLALLFQLDTLDPLGFGDQLIDIAEGGAVLVLHEIRDPGNMGTMIRSADAFGAVGVILAGSCVDPEDPRVVRSTAGSLFHLPVVQADWQQVTGWAEENRVKLYATSLDGTHPVGKVGIPKRVALVIGNEAHGLPEGVLQDSDYTVRIPMSGCAESLNAAVAAGILLFDAQRQQTVD